MRVSRVACGECGGRAGRSSTPAEVQGSSRTWILCAPVAACLCMYTFDCVPKVSSRMPLGEARMSRNPISEFCRLVEERELYSQPCPPTRLSSRPHASPGWQQLQLQGLGLGGVQSDLPWGVSPQESSADGRRGHRHNVSRPGSRLQLTLCCHQTSASL